MMHCHLKTEVLNAHSDFPESIDELSQRLSLFLANADQGNGRQVVGSASCELDIKLGHQRFKTIH